MEHIIHRQTMSHLAKHNILADQQRGVQPVPLGGDCKMKMAKVNSDDAVIRRNRPGTKSE
ncbi:hypothetical protein DPMN_164685, partial [Dreissena polymorpha]